MQIKVPTMIFEGEDDVITTPLEAHRFVIKDAGHFPWLEQPDTFFECFAVAARQVLQK